MQKNVLVMENITKVYPNGFVANRDVNLAVDEGEIHALVGENGAGKSTLMKVLFGVEKPDEGQIMFNGKEVHINNPQNAITLGIGMVYQHFMLVPSLSVAENLILGMEPKRNRFFYDAKKAIEIAQESSKQYNFAINPTTKVCDLSVGQKQKAEILKVLIRGAKIIILDEPTAVLTPQETKELFIELKGLKNQGFTIIFISHKLNEVKELCDQVTVMRSGRTVGNAMVRDISEQDISKMMVGYNMNTEILKSPHECGRKVLSVRNVVKYMGKTNKILDDVSFDLNRGEIIGIAGVEGNGQKELSEIITGLDTVFDGEVYIGEKLLSVRDNNVREIRNAGVSHIPEDRMKHGIAGELNISDNLISDRYYKADLQKGLLLNNKKIKTVSDMLIKEYGVKCGGGDEPVKMLSGGNMQKVVAAREFSSNADLIVANQPTRGIDIGASDFIRRRILQLRDEGAGVLLISADLNEIMELSDSLIVMCAGQIAAYFRNVKKVSEVDLGEYMLGIKKMDKTMLKEAVDND